MHDYAHVSTDFTWYVRSALVLMVPNPTEDEEEAATTYSLGAVVSNEEEIIRASLDMRSCLLVCLNIAER